MKGRKNVWCQTVWLFVFFRDFGRKFPTNLYISNFIAQNLGARKLLRIKEGIRAGVKIVWLICVPFVLVHLAEGRYLVYFFMKEITGTAIDTGVLFLHIVSPFYFVVSVKLVADGILLFPRAMSQVPCLHEHKVSKLTWRMPRGR